MTLIQRLRRRLGYDTTTSKTDTYPLKRYTVTHLNGETSEVVANGYETKGAFAHFKKITAPHPVLGLHGGGLAGIWPKYARVRVLEGIQEIESERVATTELEVVVDLADGSTVESEVRHGVEG